MLSFAQEISSVITARQLRLQTTRLGCRSEGRSCSPFRSFSKSVCRLFKTFGFSEKVFTVFCKSGMGKIGTLNPKSALHQSNLAMKILGRQILIRFHFNILQSWKVVLEFFISILKLLIFLVFNHNLNLHAVFCQLFEFWFKMFLGKFVGLKLDPWTVFKGAFVVFEIVRIRHLNNHSCNVFYMLKPIWR